MYFIQLDDVGVPQDLQDADLPRHSLDIRLLDYFLFLQRFDCDFGFGGDVHSESYLAEGPLPDSLT